MLYAARAGAAMIALLPHVLAKKSPRLLIAAGVISERGKKGER